MGAFSLIVVINLLNRWEMVDDSILNFWLYSTECASIDPFVLHWILICKIRNQKLTLKYKEPSVRNVLKGCLFEIVSSDRVLQDNEIEDLLWSSATSEELSLKNFIHKKIYPTYLLTFWGSSSNVVKFTRPLVGRNCTFPLGIVLPNFLCRMKKSELVSLLGGELLMNSGAKIESQTLKELKSGLETINSILGKRKFLSGDEISPIDAYLFSILYPIWKTDLPWKKTLTALKCFDNVVNYIEFISEVFSNQLKISKIAEPKHLSITNLMKNEKLKTIVCNSCIVLSSTFVLLAYCKWCKL